MIDAVDMHRRRDFVLSQLSRYGGQKKETGNRMMILCPFHSEDTPSGSIWIGDKYAGSYRCYGCKKKAKWDELAERMGLEPFKKGKPKEESSMDLLINKGLEQLTNQKRYRQDKFKFKRLPRNKKWRTIPTNLLIELGGKFCRKWNPTYKNYDSTSFIYFPVLINGEKHGFFRARLKKDESDKKLPSYLLAAAEGGSKWASTHGLWPFDFSLDLMRKLKSTTMVLVEGQRDALRLLLLGIPAVCIFGTQSWTDNKAKLLEIAGVESVILLMDGDDAGIAATEKIRPSVRKLFTVKTVRLWNITGSPYLKYADKPEPSKAAKQDGVALWDPGNVPESILNKIKAKYF
jgi:hypothetical protein